MSSARVENGLELTLLVDSELSVHALADGDELVVGRDAACRARVDDVSVSRRHAALCREGDVVHVRDLGSANGTTVRERARGGATARMRRVEGTVDVTAGAVVVFGAVVGVVRRTMEITATPIVSDLQMRAVYERAFLAARSNLSILLLGETGVGKEVLARAIHDRSPRSHKRMLALNCGALAPTLVESELFGHEKGAFTGASHDTVGLLEAANGGTVFLDEVGELPADVQVKLLRVLEERAVLPVGARAPRSIDVRVVSATHRDLEAACRAGTFRRDLLFRLEGLALTIPPLRERPSEILELANRFLARACASEDREVLTIGPAAASLLERHAWPGNVRELRNAMELAAVLCGGDAVKPEHLPDKLRAPLLPIAPPRLDDAERARIVDALARCDGNQTRAAEILGVSRRTLVSRLSSYGLTRPRK